MVNGVGGHVCVILVGEHTKGYFVRGGSPKGVGRRGGRGAGPIYLDSGNIY